MMGREMGEFTGLGDRIRARLRLLGYWRNDRPDVLRFCEERRYRPQYVYAWLKNRVPSRTNLGRLAEDLGVPMAWIVFGQDEEQVAAEQRRAPETGRREVEVPGANRPPAAEHAASPRPGRPARPAAPGWEPQVLDFKRLRDVTERLVQIEAELHAIFQAFPDGYFWLDADGTVLSYNGGRGFRTSIPPAEFLGKRLAQVLPEPVAATIVDGLRRALATHAVVGVEYTLPGGERPQSFEARLVPLPGPAESPRFLAVVRDISERTRTDEARRALVQVGHELAGTLDVAQASDRVVSAVVRLFRARGSALYRLDPAARTLECVAVAGVPALGEWVGKRLPIEGSAAGLSIAENRPVWSADLFADSRITLPDWAADRLRQAGIAVVASVPLTARGRGLGAITVADGPGRRFTDEELALLAAFADAAALAIQNAELYAEAERGRRAAESLAAVGRSLSQSLDPSEVGQRITEKVFELLRVQASALYRLEPESGELSMMAFSSEQVSGEIWNPVLPSGMGLSGLALREDRPAFVADVLADPRVRLTPENRARIERGPLRSGLSVPLVVQERAIGALTLADLPGRVFRPEEIQLVQTFADHAVLALENARLYAETEHRRQAAESLAKLGQLISRSLDPEEVAERIVESVLALLDVNASVLYRFEPASGELVSLAFAGTHSWLRRSTVVMSPGAGVSGLAVRERRPVITANALEDPRLEMTPEIRARYKRAGVYSAVAVPLIAREEVIGTISIGGRLGRVFTPEEVQLVQAFADQAATALENARLFREYQKKAEARESPPARRKGTAPSPPSRA
ncbi:MAG: GAF domain-containing protein [Candidatus Rokubacteria bacterium]|nr:GAF domain-containing protein [Candidatus Rokubacteria bacterium]